MVQPRVRSKWNRVPKSKCRGSKNSASENPSLKHKNSEKCKILAI